MAKTETPEMFGDLPMDASEEQKKIWIQAILAITPKDEVEKVQTGQFVGYQLPDVELEVYQEAVERFGKPSAVPDRNLALLMLWAFTAKYRLGLRYNTTVTKDGVFKYDLQ